QLEAIDLTIAREFTAAVTKYEAMRRRAPGRFELDVGRAYDKAARQPDALAAYRRASESPPHPPEAWLRLAVAYSRTAKPNDAAKAFGRAEERYQVDNNL